MAASNASMLVMSVVLGLTVLKETLARGNGELVAALRGLGLAISGVVLLAATGRAPERSTA